MAESPFDIKSAADEELMLKLKDNVISCFNELITRHKEPVTNFSYQYLFNYESAKDIAQETFLEVFNCRKRYKPSAKFTTWLFTIARNKCLNAIKHRKRHPEISLETSISNEKDSKKLVLSSTLKDGSKTVEEIVINNEINTGLFNAIGQLPEMYREIVIMRSFNDISYREISEITGVPEATVRKRMEYALGKLKEILSQK